MSPAAHDLTPSLRADNALLRQTVVAGETIPIGEVLSLAAAVEASYLFAAMESRELAHVNERRRVWAEVSDLFTELAENWTGVDCHAESLLWLRGRLEHFQELAIDQTRIYEVSISERLKHAANRGATIESIKRRNEPEPNDEETQSTPQHIYALSHF